MQEFWDTLIEEMEGIAQEYTENGWETVTIKPGDVTVVASEHADIAGIDVLVPRSTFETVDEYYDAERTDEESYQVYRREIGEGAMLVVVIEDANQEVAILYPALLSSEDMDRLRNDIESSLDIHTRIRPLSKDRIVTVRHENPSLFLEGSSDE